MSTWNHRVVRREYPEGVPDERLWYGIHEAYYGRSEDGNPSITTGPIAVAGESVEELRETLGRMLAALDKPVLDYETRKELPRG